MLFVGIGLCPLISIASLFTIVEKKNLTQVAIFYSIISLLEVLTIGVLVESKTSIVQHASSARGELGSDGISMLLIWMVQIIMPIVLMSTYKSVPNLPIWPNPRFRVSEGQIKDIPAPGSTTESLTRSLIYGRGKDSIIENSYRTFTVLVIFIGFWSTIVFSVQDLLLFYIGFESVLIPLYLLITLYGTRNRKIHASYMFFIYTLTGSLFLFLSLLGLYIEDGSSEYKYLLSKTITNTASLSPNQLVLWLSFFISFAVKLPIYGVHTWLLQAHVEAPTAASVLLAAILLKTGSPSAPNDTNTFKGWADGKQRWGRNRIGPHDKEIIEVIYGCLLGDGSIELTKSKAAKEGMASARFSTQKEANSTNGPYAIWFNKFLYDRGYVTNCKPAKLTSKPSRVYYLIKTVKFTSFVPIYELFYPKDKKIVPANIKEWLTPRALAIWFMDDGSKAGGGAKLATQSFTYEECKLLSQVLDELYSLKVTVNLNDRAKNQYYLRVSTLSMPLFRDLVLPYIVPSMRYKLGLELPLPYHSPIMSS